MEPLEFLNYDTTYTVKRQDKPVDVFKHTYCFKDAFLILDVDPEQSVHYTVWLNTNKQYVLKENRSNYCFLSKHELYNYVKLVKQLFDFKFRIEQQNDAFIVHIDICGSRIKHMYLLTWIRYAYEFPMNTMLQDINRLKKEEPCFRFTSKANLFLLLSYFSWNNYRYIHCIPVGKRGKFLTNKELKYRCEHRNSMNSFYEGDYNVPRIGWKNYDYLSQEDLDADYKYRRDAYLKFYNSCIKW